MEDAAYSYEKRAFQYCAPVLERLTPLVTDCAVAPQDAVTGSGPSHCLAEIGAEHNSPVVCHIPGRAVHAQCLVPSFSTTSSSLQVLKETSRVGRSVSPNNPPFIFLLTHCV